MKITFLNSTDTGGGAANACKRQAEALYRNGADITFLSQKHKGETKPYSRYYIQNKFDKGLYFIRHLLNERLLKKYPAIQHNNFSAGYYGAALENHPDIKNADIVHIHWMNDSFLTPETIQKIAKQGKKIVWTLHDMWSFTGGCHYTGSCKKYMQHCGECPVLQSKKEEDISFYKSYVTFADRLEVDLKQQRKIAPLLPSSNASVKDNTIISKISIRSTRIDSNYTIEKNRSNSKTSTLNDGLFYFIFYSYDYFLHEIF